MTTKAEELHNHRVRQNREQIEQAMVLLRSKIDEALSKAESYGKIFLELDVKGGSIISGSGYFKPTIRFSQTT